MEGVVAAVTMLVPVKGRIIWAGGDMMMAGGPIIAARGGYGRSRDSDQAP